MSSAQSNGVKAVVSLICAAGAGWAAWSYVGGSEKQATTMMQQVHDQVAEDAIKQYEITTRKGSAMEICVHAGFVKAAYLQAKDEANYARWKETEQKDCEAARWAK